jgi:YHS domain-containing protein
MTQAFIDPVCGMPVTTYTAAAQSNYKSQTYYFCSRIDKVAFDMNPERYVREQVQVKEPVPQP